LTYKQPPKQLSTRLVKATAGLLGIKATELPIIKLDPDCMRYEFAYGYVDNVNEVTQELKPNPPVIIGSQVTGWALVLVLAHELQHIVQIRRLGEEDFAESYAMEVMLHGEYHRNRYELEAVTKACYVTRELGGPNIKPSDYWIWLERNCLDPWKSSSRMLG
jgi:hypothetical protein